MCAIYPLASFHVTTSITLECEWKKVENAIKECGKGISEAIKFIIFTSDFWTAFVDENRWDKRILLPPPRLCHTIHHKNLLTHSELFHYSLVNSWHMARKKGANINKENDPESEDGCEMEIKIKKGKRTFLYSLLLSDHFAFFFHQKNSHLIVFHVTNFCSTWVNRKL